jgi:hypothetical protein
VVEALRSKRQQREGRWSESLAVGRERFVEGVKAQLKISARYREVETCVDGEGYTLREPAVAYTTHFDPKNATLSAEEGLISGSR